jgi:hypothetical protein
MKTENCVNLSWNCPCIPIKTLPKTKCSTNIYSKSRQNSTSTKTEKHKTSIEVDGRI